MDEKVGFINLNFPLIRLSWKEVPYTTFDQRLLFLRQYLRSNPLGADKEMFLQKYGLKNVEMVAFPPLKDFVSGDKAGYSDLDEVKCKFYFCNLFGNQFKQYFILYETVTVHR